jgi:OOP family OmpA-OmpF porin
VREAALKGCSSAGGRIAACLALAVLAAGPARAQYEDEPLPSWYAGPFLGFAFADADRNATDAVNLHLVAGRVIHDAFSVELSLFATKFGSDAAGGADADLLGAGVDLALGLPARGHPVFLLGAGAAQHDIGGEGRTQAFGTVGLGYYLPVGFGSELWRVEARYHLLLGEHPALPDEDLVEDVRLNLGVLFTFGGEDPAPLPERRPEPPPESRIVAPAPPPAAPLALADADGDGVADVDDACPDTTPGTAVDARGCVKPERVVIRSAYFGSNSSSPTAKVYEVLRQVADAMQADPRMRLEVEGHSDVSGRTGRNLALSQQRAEVVRRLLIGFGVAPERLTARGYGESRPVNDNDTLEKRAYNRRVEFRRLDAGAP